MAALTYFTAKLLYQVAVADEAGDIDADPQIKGAMAGVTLAAFIEQPPPTADDVHPDEIVAATLTPEIAMLVLPPIDARLDNGRLMLRVAPDRVVDSYPSSAGFPPVGSSTKLYRAADTNTTYEYKGGGYVVNEGYAPVRLVAQTAVLGLPADAFLCYSIAFDHVTFGGKDQELPAFAFRAPTSDVVLDLATAPRVKLP